MLPTSETGGDAGLASLWATVVVGLASGAGWGLVVSTAFTGSDLVSAPTVAGVVGVVSFLMTRPWKSRAERSIQSVTGASTSPSAGLAMVEAPGDVVPAAWAMRMRWPPGCGESLTTSGEVSAASRIGRVSVAGSAVIEGTVAASPAAVSSNVPILVKAIVILQVRSWNVDLPPFLSVAG